MRNVLLTAALAAVTLPVLSCKKEVPPPAPVVQASPLPAPVTPAPPPPPVEVEDEALVTIHFDFDSADLRTDQLDELRQDLRVLQEDETLRIRIEGNCDERGTTDYNLALGERRARSARDWLVARGISPSRLETISYGEEKPVDPGHDESAWARNRRDDFVPLDMRLSVARQAGRLAVLSGARELSGARRCCARPCVGRPVRRCCRR